MGFLSDHMNNKMEMDELLREYEAANHPMNVYAAHQKMIDTFVRRNGYARAPGPMRPANPAKRPSAAVEGGSCDIFEFTTRRIAGRDVLFGRNMAVEDMGWQPVGT